MRAFAALVANTLRQLLGRRRLLLLLLLSLLPAVVLLVALAHTRSSSTAFRTFHDQPLGILFLVVLPIASLVFGAAALGDERRDATLSFILLRPLPRSSLATAKLLGAWAASFAVVGPGAVAMSVVLGIRGGGWQTLGPLLLGVAVATLAYAAVFLLLGYLTGRAVLVGLVYAFVWESGMTTAIPSLATVSLMRIGLSAYAALVPASRAQLANVLGVVEPGAGGALAKTLVVALVAVTAVATLLRHRDVA
jgi:ABC-2 type transport system permease protein